MRTFTIALLFTMMATILVWSEGASATDTILLTIDFGGECAAKTQAGDLKAGPVKLELTQNGNTFTCGHYKIQRQNSAAGEARLEAADDDNGDVLALLNARITKLAGTWPDLHITISGKNKYEPAPATIPSGSDVSYKVSAEGFFKRGITNQLAVGSYLKTRGFQDNPTQTAPMFWLGSDPPSTSNGVELDWTVCGGTGCNNWLPSYYNTMSTWVKNRDTLDSTRDLQAEFWLNLYNNSDSLNLNNLTVQNTLGGGGAKKPDPKEIPPGCPEVTCIPSINE